MKELKTGSYNPGSMTLMTIFHTPFVSKGWSSALIDYFQFLAQRNLIWKRIELLKVDSLNHSNKPVQDTLRAVNTLQICQELSLEARAATLPTTDLPLIFPGFSQNLRLRCLELFAVGHECYTQGDMEQLRQTLQHSTNLKELSLGSLSPNHFETFVDSLGQNTSLKKLHLRYYNHQLLLPSLVDKVCSHPNFESLSIDFSKMEEEDFRTIARLLKESRLISLSIDCGETGSRQTSLFLLEGISNSPTIKELRLPEFNEVKFSEIMQVVLKKDTLRSFHLKRIELSALDDEDLKAIAEFKRRRTPLTLKLPDYIYSNSEYPNIMERMLNAHPGIRIQIPLHMNGCSTRAEFLRDFNWHGRYLLERTDIPLSLWPQVIQAASKSEPRILFEFLKGQALAARSNLGSERTELMDKNDNKLEIKQKLLFDLRGCNRTTSN
ncbi:MAG: hypothetical protein SGBAC_008616 [Bacillariaceae sp.]